MNETLSTPRRPVQETPKGDAVAEAVAAVAAGAMVVVVDEERPEQGGVLAMAAAHASQDALAFFLKHTSGLIEAPMAPERTDALGLPPMAATNRTGAGPTVTVDLRHGTTTGISAGDRSATLRALADPRTSPGDLARPGHIFPSRCAEGGVLAEARVTEATVDLVTAAGLPPVGVQCELLSPDKLGLADRGELDRFCATHRTPRVGVAEIRRHRFEHETLVQLVSEARLPAERGKARALVYRSVIDQKEHLAMVFGEPRGMSGVPVAVHRECVLSDALNFGICDCGPRLQRALDLMAEEDLGVLIYARTSPTTADHRRRRHHVADGAGGPLRLARDDPARQLAMQILQDLGVKAPRMLDDLGGDPGLPATAQMTA